MPNGGAAPLHELGSQPAPVGFVGRSGEVGGQGCEVRVQQRQQGAECILFTTVRGGRDQNDVTVGVSGEAGNQLVALMPGRTPLPAPRTGVGFIDNDEFGTGPQKLVAAAAGLDEVKGDDNEGMMLE